MTTMTPPLTSKARISRAVKRASTEGILRHIATVRDRSIAEGHADDVKLHSQQNWMRSLADLVSDAPLNQPAC
jgi:hypothetical protein